MSEEKSLWNRFVNKYRKGYFWNLCVHLHLQFNKTALYMGITFLKHYTRTEYFGFASSLQIFTAKQKHAETFEEMPPVGGEGEGAAEITEQKLTDSENIEENTEQCQSESVKEMPDNVEGENVENTESKQECVQEMSDNAEGENVENAKDITEQSQTESKKEMLAVADEERTQDVSEIKLSESTETRRNPEVTSIPTQRKDTYITVDYASDEKIEEKKSADTAALPFSGLLNLVILFFHNTSLFITRPSCRGSLVIHSKILCSSNVPLHVARASVLSLFVSCALTLCSYF